MIFFFIFYFILFFFIFSLLPFLIAFANLFSLKNDQVHNWWLQKQVKRLKPLWVTLFRSISMCCVRYKLLKIKSRCFGDSGQKQYWWQHGDANTKYFHQLASARKRKNSFKQLKDESGIWLNWDSGLQAHIYKYFNDLFSSHGCEVDLVLSKVRKMVSSSHNEDMLRPFDPGEVKSAMFSMFGEKSSDPEDLNPGFFQHYWELVGSDVTNFCLSCLNDMCFPNGLNSIAIVLIPKKNNPETLPDLRLIALWNVVYKIMAKMLANRMKGMMNEVI